MKLFFRFFSFLLFILLLSCSKTAEPLYTLGEKITIQEAKKWLETTLSSARLSGEKIESEIYWDYAFETFMDESSTKGIVIVPISHFTQGEYSTGYKQAWIYKDKLKNKTMRVVEFIYDSKIPRENLGNYSIKNFTGTMLVREWDNKIIGGFTYKNGVVIAGLTDISEAKNGKQPPIRNGRVKLLDCYNTETCTYGYNYIAGNPEDRWYWTQCSTSIECVWRDSFNQDGTPPPTSGGYSPGGGPFTSYFKRFSEHDDPCAGLNQALLAQSNEMKEMFGLVTDNNIIILPNETNKRYEFVFKTTLKTDVLGRPIVSLIENESNKTWSVILYYYHGTESNSHAQSFHNIKGFFHTHPIESGYGWDYPSPEDKATAENFSGLAHYIVHNNAVIKYNSNGETNRLSNWKNNCGGLMSFF